MAPGDFINTLDLVPKAWNYEDLGSIDNLFPGEQAPKCGDACSLAIDLAQTAVGHSYFQPMDGTPLNNEQCLYSEAGNWFPFEDEADSQHSALFYMWLLGIPLEPIRALFPEDNWSPPPNCSQSVKP